MRGKSSGNSSGSEPKTLRWTIQPPAARETAAVDSKHPSAVAHKEDDGNPASARAVIAQAPHSHKKIAATVVSKPVSPAVHARKPSKIIAPKNPNAARPKAATTIVLPEMHIPLSTSSSDFSAKRAALRKASVSYSRLLDSIYDAVFVTEPSGLVVDLNPRAVDFFKLPIQIDTHFNVLDFISGADVALLHLIEQQLLIHKFTLIEAHCVRTDGTYFPGEIAVSRIDIGDAPRLCFFVRDISVRKRVLAKLEDANERLQENDRHRMEFISNVSHELRTPLTSMIYGIRNMLSGVVGELPPEARASIESLDSDCRRMLSTVNDILDLHKIENGTLTLDKAVFPVSRLVHSCVDSLRIQAAERSQTIVEAAIRDKGTFTGSDLRKVERVVINVIGNALKYTEDGGVIEVSTGPCEDMPGFVQFKCVDNGIGIPPEALPRVTERYFRVGDQVAGTGLGLSISREIVQLHGGNIEIKSPPPGREKGTMVRIMLPSAPPPRVMVVEDDALVRDLLLSDIADNGYNVIGVDTASRALAAAKSGKVDIIVLDMTLPDLDGSQVILRLKGAMETSRIPILVVSGADATGRDAKILSRFRIPMLNKPWKPEELFTRIALAFFPRSATSPS